MLNRIILSVVGLGMLASPAFADATGNWRSAKNSDGASISVKIKKCGSTYCGHITKVHNSKKKGGVGLLMIKNMKSKDGKKYSGGQIFAPDTEKWYSSTMKLSGKNLRVSGCVAKIFCRSQTWRRE